MGLHWRSIDEFYKADENLPLQLFVAVAYSLMKASGVSKNELDAFRYQRLSEAAAIAERAGMQLK